MNSLAFPLILTKKYLHNSTLRAQKKKSIRLFFTCAVCMCKKILYLKKERICQQFMSIPLCNGGFWIHADTVKILKSTAISDITASQLP